MRARRDPAHVRRPRPRREAPRRPRRQLEQRLELLPALAAVVAAEQPARLGAGVHRAVGRADGEREDARLGQPAVDPASRRRRRCAARRPRAGPRRPCRGSCGVDGEALRAASRQGRARPSTRRPLRRAGRSRRRSQRRGAPSRQGRQRWQGRRNLAQPPSNPTMGAVAVGGDLAGTRSYRRRLPAVGRARRAKLGPMAEEELFRRGTVLVRRLRLEPGEAMPWHRDPFHRVTVVLAGDSLVIEARDGSELARFEVTPGQVDWDEPSDRIHRGVNVGALTYEEAHRFCSPARRRAAARRGVTRVPQVGLASPRLPAGRDTRTPSRTAIICS